MFYCTLNDETELRLLEIRHAAALFSLTDSSRDHLRGWLPWVDDIKHIDDSRRFIESGLRQFAEQDGFHAGIWHKGHLAGIIGLHGIHWGNRSTSVGYWLGGTFQGKGLIILAAKSLVAYCFEELHLERVEIRVAEGNTRSRAIPERLGFKQEGTLRNAESLYDEFVDHVVYSKLASEHV